MSRRFTAIELDRMSPAEAQLRGLVTAVPAGAHPEAQPATIVERWSESGTVYAIQSEISGSPVKVGYSNDWGVPDRLKSLQTGNPYKLRIIASAMGYMSHERRCHKILRPHRLNGEWFAWCPEVSAFVEALDKRGVEHAIATIKIMRDPLS